MNNVIPIPRWDPIPELPTTAVLRGGNDGPLNLQAKAIANCLAMLQSGEGSTRIGHGGGTLAGLLHRNLIACGAADQVQLLISDSVAAAKLFADESLAWVHLDARHDYDSVCADITAWLPKVRPGGWLSGDDYDEWQWPGVVQAVADTLDGTTGWSKGQWRWLNPADR